jgi:hypothetical protein
MAADNTNAEKGGCAVTQSSDRTNLTSAALLCIAGALFSARRRQQTRV